MPPRRSLKAKDTDWDPSQATNASDSNSDSDFSEPKSPSRSFEEEAPSARPTRHPEPAANNDAGANASASSRGKASATASKGATTSKKTAEASKTAKETKAASSCSKSAKSAKVKKENGDAEDQQGKPKPKKARKPQKPKETAEQRLHRIHPEIKGVWADLASSTDVSKLKLIDQPKDMTIKLLPFQIEGVSWMVQQEVDSVFRGGILADEMGLGKTVQTIALNVTRPSPDPAKPCLVVCPSVALLQWKSEILSKTVPNRFKVLVYHGASRVRDAKEITKHDIILTTFSIVESEFRRMTQGYTRNGQKVKQASTLHSIEYFRLILDEAHYIKERHSNTARAVFDLKADYKWSLSGTPLQNRVGELYSLVKVLRSDPYSYYFCRQCDCKSLTWRFTQRVCDCCGHRSMSHFCWWNREILRPIQKHGPVGEGKLAFDRLQQLLGAMMLRRTKFERGKELGLPPRVVHTRRDLFSHEEEDFYEALYSESKTRFQSFVREGTVLNNYAHIFELLMRMRQATNHPWMVTHRADSKNDKDTCGICYEAAEDPIVSDCKHVFCREEMKMYLNSAMVDTPSCPKCFRPLSIDITQPAMQIEEAPKKRARSNIVRRLDLEAWQSSTKIECILEELSAAQTEGATIKTVVFSQFTTFLDLLEWRLQRAGVRCVKLDGRMAPAHRAVIIDAFNTQPAITVFLISLKAGGIALNLVSASRVFITDPWWNPAVESQAMDRIHRLGQHRPIEVKRFIVENSIESRIDQLQEKKRLLFESTVGNDSSALGRLTEEDLQFLFVM